MAKRKAKEDSEFKKAYEEWSEKEDELIMNSPLPDKDISELLDRSLASIHSRRYTIRNRKEGRSNGE